MSMSIVKPGVLDTLQDLGRFGYARWGISESGAMDRYAAQLANFLVGNDSGETVIECHFPGPQILFEQTMLIAITGADFGPQVNGHPISCWRPVIVRRNSILAFSQWYEGARCYLGFHGGLQVAAWLGSTSTHLHAKAGGWFGKKLEKDTELQLKEGGMYLPGLLRDDQDFVELSWHARPDSTYERMGDIAVVAGNEWQQLPQSSRETFLDKPFVIRAASDRMGCQLTGMPLKHQIEELISSAVVNGTIQLLPEGQLVVLMADHQTTGGYPRIAHVITAHLPKLSQLRAGNEIRFSMTDLDSAEELYFRQQSELRVLQRACLDHLNDLL